MPVILKILLIVIGSLLLIMGSLLLIALRLRDRHYQEQIKGSIIDSSCKEGKLWYAQYSFDYNGRTYNGVEQVGHAEPHYKPGDEIEIRFNRLNPQLSEPIREDEMRTKLYKALIHTGGILLIIGLILFALKR